LKKFLDQILRYIALPQEHLHARHKRTLFSFRAWKFAVLNVDPVIEWAMDPKAAS